MSAEVLQARREFCKKLTKGDGSRLQIKGQVVTYYVHENYYNNIVVSFSDPPHSSLLHHAMFAPNMTYMRSMCQSLNGFGICADDHGSVLESILVALGESS